MNEEQLRECADLYVKIAELESKIIDVEAERSQFLVNARAQISLAVRAMSVVYPATTISIGWQTTAFEHELKGPASIELRETDEDVTLVAVNQVMGTIEYLEREDVSVDDLLTGLQPDDAAEVNFST